MFSIDIMHGSEIQGKEIGEALASAYHSQWLIVAFTLPVPATLESVFRVPGDWLSNFLHNFYGKWSSYSLRRTWQPETCHIRHFYDSAEGEENENCLYSRETMSVNCNLQMRWCAFRVVWPWTNCNLQTRSSTRVSILSTNLPLVDFPTKVDRPESCGSCSQNLL